MPKRVIIDTDPGVDDCAAILLALASPELQVDALTISYGNGSMPRCADNARRILAAAGRSDIPVYPGAEGPLIRPPTAGWASHIHGGDALGEVTDGPPTREPADGNPARRAAVELAARALTAPGEITVLALGRMTNVALALRLGPGDCRRAGRRRGDGRSRAGAGQRVAGGYRQSVRRPGSGGDPVRLRSADHPGGAGRLRPLPAFPTSSLPGSESVRPRRCNC